MTDGEHTSTGRRARAHERPSTGTGETLGDVDHTNPHTGRTFGGNFTFARGGTVAADGGNPDVVPEDDDENPDATSGADDENPDAVPEDDEEPDTLADVSHETPNDSEDANRAFERGRAGVADDE